MGYIEEVNKFTTSSEAVRIHQQEKQMKNSGEVGKELSVLTTEKADEASDLVSGQPRFTPGPWRYYTGKLRPQFSTIVHEIQDADGTAIVAWSGFDGVDFSQDEIAANARLVAAAPDLYAALNNLVAVAHRSSWAHIENADCGCKGCCIDQARTALALARGQDTNTRS